jgi:hypothetical protein
MRAPSETDKRDKMLAQIVDAFMADDTPRYREACDWLIAYAYKARSGNGKIRINHNWFDPAKMDEWRARLRESGRKGGWATRRRRSSQWLT